MADKQADPHPTIPNGYHIPIDSNNLGDFPAQRHVAVVLNDAHSAYHVFHKQIPAHLNGKEHRGKPIQWINNFGLKKKGKDHFADGVPEYEIHLDHIENGEYVYFDGTEIRPLETTRHSTDPTKVRAVLSLGDPPVGWAG